jgi:hypothetical protein
MFFFLLTVSRQFASVNNTISLTLNFNFESGCSKISYTSVEPFCYATQLGKVPYSCALGILRRNVLFIKTSPLYILQQGCQNFSTNRETRVQFNTFNRRIEEEEKGRKNKKHDTVELLLTPN